VAPYSMVPDAIEADAVATPIGNLPAKGSLDVAGLAVSDEQMDVLTSVDREVWREEAAHIPPFYERFAERLPAALWEELAALQARLDASPAAEPAVERLAG